MRRRRHKVNDMVAERSIIRGFPAKSVAAITEESKSTEVKSPGAALSVGKF